MKSDWILSLPLQRDFTGSGQSGAQPLASNTSTTVGKIEPLEGRGGLILNVLKFPEEGFNGISCEYIPARRQPNHSMRYGSGIDRKNGV